MDAAPILLASYSSLRASPLSLPLGVGDAGKLPSPGRPPRRRLCCRASSTVTLLDYGAGNVRSLRNAVRHLGYDVKDVTNPRDIINAECLVFPGVGAFATAMEALNQMGMTGALCRYIEEDRPFLGICLGLQLLFESSEENGPVKGLGLVPGVVGHFDSTEGIKVPHMGWNLLNIFEDSLILDDVKGHRVNFAHSYRTLPSEANRDWISSTCNYGEEFISSIRRGNVHAVQFRPEKSGDVGLSILRRFLSSSLSSGVTTCNGNTSKLAKRENDKGDLVA